MITMLDTLPMPKKEAPLPLAVTPEIKARLQAMAKLLDRSVNWLATKYILDGLEADEAKSKRLK